MTAVLSPSDVLNCPEGPVRVGGRVRLHPSRSWQIADAFVAIDVMGEARAPVDGHLLVLQAEWKDGVLQHPCILEVHEVMGGVREASRLLDRGVGHALRKRALAMKSIRQWFDERGFFEVETPQRIPSPGLDLHLDAFSSDGAYLVTSPEYQMKRLLVGGMPRIYQLAHCFRKEEQGHLHNSEFTMLEWYRAFAGIDDIIRDTEEVIAHVAEFFRGEKALRYGKRAIRVQPPFPRITVVDAFEKYAGLDEEKVLWLAEFDEDTYFRLLVEKVEPGLATWENAVVLWDFPAVHASLARRKPSDPRFCERFEIYAGGVELCNGFGELRDAREQRSRFENDQKLRRETGKPQYPIDERFLEAMEEGMPPSAGNALGVDRLIALGLGLESIQGVMSFPDAWL